MSNSKKDNKHEFVSDAFFFSFMGEFVELCGSFFHGESEATIKLEGYLLDADDTYYFLGDDDQEIVHSIKKDRVIWINIKTIESEYQTILKDMDIPQKEEEKN